MRIKTSLALSFLAVSLVPLGLVAAFALFQVEQAMTREALSHLDVLATLQKGRVEAFIDRNLQRYELVARSSEVRAALARFAATDRLRPEPASARAFDASKRARSALERAFDLVRTQDTAIETISLIDPWKHVLASTNPALFGTDLSDAEYSREPGALPRLFVSFPPGRQGPLVRISGPIADGRLALMVRTRGRELADVVGNYAGMGETGESFLALQSPEGDALMITPLRFDREAALRRTVARDAVQVPITHALNREETTLTDAVDYRGKPVLAATRFIPATGWGLVVKIDRREAFAGIDRLRLIIGPVFALAVGIAILVSLFLSDRITAPIRELTRAARRIQEGDLKTRLGSASSNEIGVLARTLEQMSDRLLEANSDLERKVHERTLELASTNADLEQFAYVASHDLQEPLRTVTSYLGLLQRRYRGRLDSDADEFIAFAVDAAARMRQLISDLLTYSRVGRPEAPAGPADIEALAQVAVANLKNAIDETGAVVEIGSLPTLPCLRGQVVQLFQNLIGNALKYRGSDAPLIRVDSVRRGLQFEFRISDNGIGISQEYHERIFLIFQRLHGKREYPGTGIGLAICKKIVEAHGGRIWVTSEANAGATFHFTLPADEALARKESA